MAGEATAGPDQPAQTTLVQRTSRRVSQILGLGSRNDADSKKLSPEESLANNALLLDVKEMLAQSKLPNAIEKVQQVVRDKILYRERLHRKLLVQRLEFEQDVQKGLFRLVNLLLIFIFLTCALRVSDKSDNKRGIYMNLKEAYQLDAFKEVQTIDGLKDIISQAAASSKRYQVLSSEYFVEEDGMYQFVYDWTTFSGPKRISNAEVRVDETNFTMTTWLKVPRNFEGGYIARKAASSSAEGLVVTCWGWYLHPDLGPVLHYGGHDLFQYPSAPGSEHYITVGGNTDAGPQDGDGEAVLLAVVVQGLTATFYQGTTATATVALERPLTDCSNPQGILVGDAGLTLAQLHFYPQVLQPHNLEEIMKGGSRLADLTTGTMAELAEAQGQDVAAFMQQVRAVDLRLAEGFSHIPTEVLNVQLEGAWGGEAPAAEEVGGLPLEGDLRPALLWDAASGRDYTALIPPEIHAAGTPQEGGRRHVASMPSFRGTGVTFTFWHQSAKASGGYVLVKQRKDSTGLEGMCWGIWVEQNAIYVTGASGKSIYPSGFIAEESRPRVESQQWRHMAWQYDNETDAFSFFLDGVRAYSLPMAHLDTAVPDVDCAGEAFVTTVGYRLPGLSYSDPSLRLADLRMYVGGPLREAHLEAIQAQWPHAPNERCKRADDVADDNWQDPYSHDCRWYSEASKRHPVVCSGVQAREHCPVACAVHPMCLQAAPAAAPQLLWDRIRRMEPGRARHGLLCLSDGIKVETVVGECEQFLQQTPEADRAEALRSYLGNLASHRPRIDLLQCSQLPSLIDPHCSFSAATVGNFTQQLRAAGGDFTVMFWARPVSGRSVDARGKFSPQVVFYSRLHPPQPAFMMLPSIDATHGEVRFFSACEGTRAKVEVGQANSEGWTMFALSFSNTSSPTFARSGSSSQITREDSGSTGAKDWHHCLLDPEALFSAIEISQDMLISPIVLRADVAPRADVQTAYYALATPMAARLGPDRANRDRLASRIEVSKESYNPSMALVAPPILFFQRAQQGPCPAPYGNEWIALQQEVAAREKCAAPRECPVEVLSTAAATMACQAGVLEGRFHDLAPTAYHGRRGFTDFLYSFTEQPFVWRSGQEVRLGDLLDSLTMRLELSFLLFTPRTGTISALRLAADMTGHSTVALEQDVAHYEMLEGDRLGSFLVLQGFCCALVAIKTAFLGAELLALWARWRAHVKEVRETPAELQPPKPPPWFALLFGPLLDAVTVIVAIVYIVFKTADRVTSEDNISDVIGRISSIPWSSSEVSMAEKSERFFADYDEVGDLIDSESNLNALGLLALCILLFRILALTNVHPRLALLTGCLKHAADDLWHTALLVVVLLCCFGFIGYWRFGSERADFGTFNDAISTEVEMLFGSFPDEWTESMQLRLFTLAYLFITFLLVLNFLLAIIVEAYMVVREDNKDNLVEREFCTDLYLCVQYNVLQRVYGWPSRERLLDKLGQINAKFSIGYRELRTFKVFRNTKAISSFIKHHKAVHDFLEPQLPQKDQLDLIGDVIDERVALLLQRDPPTLQQKLQAQSRKKSLASTTKPEPPKPATPPSPGEGSNGSSAATGMAPSGTGREHAGDKALGVGESEQTNAKRTGVGEAQAVVQPPRLLAAHTDPLPSWSAMDGPTSHPTRHSEISRPSSCDTSGEPPPGEVLWHGSLQPPGVSQSEATLEALTPPVVLPEESFQSMASIDDAHVAPPTDADMLPQRITVDPLPTPPPVAARGADLDPFQIPRPVGLFTPPALSREGLPALSPSPQPKKPAYDPLGMNNA